MNGVALTFLLISAAAQMSLPRRWAPMPLLMGACYMTNAQSIDVGPFHFTVLRLLVLLGAIRALTRGERLVGGLKGLDKLVLAWAACMVGSSVFHQPFSEAIVSRLGLAYNGLGVYFLLRMFCQGREDLIQIIKITAFLLVPVAIEMVNEKLTARNLFAYFGGVPEDVLIRDGKLRAQGPFGHAILGGTVGAMCLPMMIGIWRDHALVAKIGLAACLTMVVASTSSGPIMSVVFGVFALVLWKWRHLTRKMRIGLVVVYIFFDIIMSDPAYFLLARIDLTGSSTGWHRAELIRSAFEHVNEWWFSGSDYTRHWMLTGLPISPNHVDITNHYLFYGVIGGLPLMIIFICMLWAAFRYVGESLELSATARFEEQFPIWSLGATLFAHVVTCLSIAYFDQSVTFLFLTLALIGSIRATTMAEAHEPVSPAHAFAPPQGNAEPLWTARLLSGG